MPFTYACDMYGILALEKYVKILALKRVRVVCRISIDHTRAFSYMCV